MKLYTFSNLPTHKRTSIDMTILFLSLAVTSLPFLFILSLFGLHVSSPLILFVYLVFINLVSYNFKAYIILKYFKDDIKED